MRSTLSAVLTLAATTSVGASPHDVKGLWLTEAIDGHVRIVDYRDGSPCGTLIWVDPATTETLLDARNPDEALRSRPLVGVPIIWGYEKSRKQWRRGRLYNPEDGNTFRSTIKLLDDGTLEVKGCLGPLCRTNIWTPVEPSNDEALQ